MDTRSDVFEHKRMQGEVPVVGDSAELALAKLEATRWRVIAGFKAQELDRITDERDLLAARVKAQRQDILILIERISQLAAELRAIKGEPEPQGNSVLAAIDVMQRQGVR